MDLKKRNEEMRDFFNEKADGYDDVHLPMIANKEAITEALPKNTMRVLDLGAGTGLELIPLFERFPKAHVTVIDISIEMLNGLMKRPFADRIDVVCGDFFSAEFSENYDAVISSAALHHFEAADKLKLYKKVFESLRSGGVFINSDRCLDTVEDEIQIFKDFREHHQLVRHFDTPLAHQTEVRILVETGFKDIFIRDLDERHNYKLISARKSYL